MLHRIFESFSKTAQTFLILCGILSQISPALAQEADFWSSDRTIVLYRTATKEKATVTFFKNGQYQNAAITEACHILRDVQENQTVLMDVQLLNLFRGIAGYFENKGKKDVVFHIQSGFRTLKTNSKYLKEGAARNSMHLYGKAVDFYIPGVSVLELDALVKYFSQGGVGLYMESGFVHMDTGPIRYWSYSKTSKKMTVSKSAKTGTASTKEPLRQHTEDVAVFVVPPERKKRYD